jgi:hypothetical protein
MGTSYDQVFTIKFWILALEILCCHSLTILQNADLKLNHFTSSYQLHRSLLSKHIYLLGKFMSTALSTAFEFYKVLKGVLSYYPIRVYTETVVCDQQPELNRLFSIIFYTTRSLICRSGPLKIFSFNKYSAMEVQILNQMLSERQTYLPTAKF